MIKNFNKWLSIKENMSYESNWVLIKEALKPEQEKQYLEIIRSPKAEEVMDSILNKISSLPGAKWSDERDRVYVPFYAGGEYQESPLESQIKNVLSSVGYEIKNYQQGIAVDKNIQNREIKIGKVLTRLKQDDLLKKFREDKTRETVKLSMRSMMLVFSKNKIDIASMSTGRGWTSCMNLDTGINAKYVSCDVEEGTIICYLTSSDDKNVETPNSRILIKPYINFFNVNDIIYIPDPSYGTAPKNFATELDKIMREIQRGKEGIYLMIQKLYQDQPKTDVRRGIMTFSEEGFKGTVTDITKSVIYGKRTVKTKQEIEKILEELIIERYSINDDLSVDVKGDVDLTGLKMKVFPFQFGKVSGDFDCSGNELTSLKGSPRELGGVFLCVSSGLKSLEGSPVEAKLFDCSDNELTSLKGCPTKTLAFRCSKNFITDFDVEMDVKLTFTCLDNQPTLTKEMIMQHPGISADEYLIGTSKDEVPLNRNYNELPKPEEKDNVQENSKYIGNRIKNEKPMLKKFNQWVNESLHSGVPVDFFKKIHQYSKNRPLSIQDDITDDLVNNDLEDVSHHFYELGTNPPEEEK